MKRAHYGGVNVEDLLARVPRALPGSLQHPALRYELVDDLIAIHGGVGPWATPSWRFGGDITVQPASEVTARMLEEATVSPVYRRVPGGGLVVPTGRVLVRFGEGDRADGHGAELADAGYQIEEVLSYAPHAAWVRARGGDFADTLAKLSRLGALSGVENVEPQMIGEVARRS